MKLSAKALVKELDKKIIGQSDAKRVLAIAIRNRWRRTQLNELIQKTVTPKNILMIGSTGVGKTALVKTVAEIIDAPLLKVEATRYTQVGYVGQNISSIVKDLASLAHADKIERKKVYLAGENDFNFNKSETETNKVIKEFSNLLSDFYSKSITHFNDIYPLKQITGFKKMISDFDPRLSDITDINHLSIIMLHSEIIPDKLSSTAGVYNKKREELRIKFINMLNIYKDFFDCYGREEAYKEVNIKEYVEKKGIIFIDEIDKIAGHSDPTNDNIGKIGVQRDLLALLDGTTVPTPFGTINTENILFIVAGVFNMVKVEDLMPELLGRLPIFVELEDMTKDMLFRILKDIDNSIMNQYRHLLSVDGVELIIADDALLKIAEIADDINRNHRNMGARTLYKVVEDVLSEISYKAFKNKDLVKKVVVHRDDIKYDTND